MLSVTRALAMRALSPCNVFPHNQWRQSPFQQAFTFLPAVIGTVFIPLYDCVTLRLSVNVPI
jgi:hypothetical protein